MAMGFFSATRVAELKPGDAAPAFELRDQHGEFHKPADYRGQWLVLYFYPRDNTPGCTAEACTFRDNTGILKGMKAAVLGVSLDNVDSHRKFAEKYHLPFPLLSDVTGQVAGSYGCLWGLGPLRFARRHTFIIDPLGNIAEIYRSVTPGTHSDEVTGRIKALHSAWQDPGN